MQVIDSMSPRLVLVLPLPVFEESWRKDGWYESFQKHNIDVEHSD